MASSQLQDDDIQDLNKFTGISKEEESAIDKKYADLIDKSKNKGNTSLGSEPLSKESLSKAEAKPAAGAAVDQTGWYKPHSKATGKGQGFVNIFWGSPFRKRSTVIGGSLSAALITMVVGGFSFIASHELVTIENAVLGKETQILKKTENDVDENLAKQVVCRALPGGCNDGNPADKSQSSKDSPADEQTASDEAQKRPLAIDEDKVAASLTTPQVESRLATQGINVVTDSSGKLQKLEDSNGNTIDPEELDGNTSQFAAFNAAEPEASARQVNLYSKEMTADAGVDQTGLPDKSETSEETQQELTDKVEVGADSQEIATSETSTTDQTTAIVNNKPVSEPINAEQNFSGPVGKLLDTAEKASAAGASGPSAIAKALSGFNLTDKVSLIATIGTVCSIKKEVDLNLLARIPGIITLLMRHGNLLLTLADQLKTGQITGQQVSTVMSDFQSDPSAFSAVAGNNTVVNEASLPYTQSAEWYRDNNLTITNPGNPIGGNYTPDISPSSLPSPNGAQELLNELEGVLNTLTLGTANGICAIFNSVFGFVIQSVLGLAVISLEVTSCVAGCVAGIAVQAVQTAAIIAAYAILQEKVLPDLLMYLLPIGINFHEDAVQQLNNDGAGVRLSANDDLRHMGGAPLSSSDSATLTNQAQQAATVAYNREPLSYRVFAFTNPQSLVSRIMLDLPTSFSSTLADIGNFFTSLPSTIARDIGEIFLNRAYADTSTPVQAPWQAYDTVDYGFVGDTDVKYDPLMNENYLYSTTPGYGGDPGVVRITALGSPVDDNGVPIPPDSDTSTNDLLHCFNLGFDQLMTNANNADNYCGTIKDGYYYGIGQMSNYNPNPDGTLSAQDANIFNPDSPNRYFTSPNSPPVTAGQLAATLYCQKMSTNGQFPSGTMAGCVDALTPSSQDDVTHYEQYIADCQSMSDYVSLTTSN